MFDYYRCRGKNKLFRHPSEIRERAMVLYQANIGVCRIEKILGVDRHTIHKWAKAVGILRPRYPQEALAPRMVELYVSGKSLKEAAHILKVPWQRVAYYVQKAGVQRTMSEAILLRFPDSEQRSRRARYAAMTGTPKERSERSRRAFLDISQERRLENSRKGERISRTARLRAAEKWRKEHPDEVRKYAARGGKIGGRRNQELNPHVRENGFGTKGIVGGEMLKSISEMAFMWFALEANVGPHYEPNGKGYDFILDRPLRFPTGAVIPANVPLELKAGILRSYEKRQIARYRRRWSNLLVVNTRKLWYPLSSRA